MKTLHPAVHAGILADRRKPEHVAQLEELGIAPFDLVVVNLYPFTETVASGASPDECVEQIDIGGPAMVRAAAKNHPSVAVVVDPAAVRRRARRRRRRRLHPGRAAAAGRRRVPAHRVLRHRRRLLDGQRARARRRHAASRPGSAASWERADVLRYGENPHQGAALYRGGRARASRTPSSCTARQMSYNNYVDTDAAWRAAHDHADPCVAIIKHANPCGIAVGADIAAAHRKAHACDPVSAFGGVIAANREVDLTMAEQVAEVFTEVVVAPSFTDDAVARADRQEEHPAAAPAARARRRVPRCGRSAAACCCRPRDRLDAPGDDPTTWTLATGEPLDAAGLDDLVFAWRAVRAVKSNAILLAHDRATVGVGMGQVNRVDSARLAVARAGERAAGSVAASDAFFPFADGLQVLLDAGVRAVVQPGGSVRDEEVVAAAAAAGVPLYLTGTRHFAH